MATCVVSYLDTSGIRHTVEVEADSLYEATVLGVKAFREHDCEPGEVRPIEVEIRKVRCANCHRRKTAKRWVGTKQKGLNMCQLVNTLLRRRLTETAKSFRISGEPSRARTCDPLIKSQLLYQLSYRPIKRKKIIRG